METSEELAQREQVLESFLKNQQDLAVDLKLE